MSLHASSFTTVDEVEFAAESQMDKTVSDLQTSLSTIRTGRASVSVLDSVKVEAYGTMMPINQVATLHVPEPSLITVQPFDVSQIGAIEKAIMAADLGLNPANDGKIIRLPVPPLTEERRKEIVKRLHHIVEEHRVSVRNVRRDANDILKKMMKDKVISEDAEHRALDVVQKLTDEHIAKLDKVSKAKETEIMQV